MKNTVLFLPILLLISFLSCFNNSREGDKELYASVQKLLGTERIDKRLNSLINKETGVIVLYSVGTNPIYTKIDNFDENFKYLQNNNIPFWCIDELKELNYNKAFILKQTNVSVVDCENIKKFGIFIENTENKFVISKSIRFLIENCKFEDCQPDYIKKLKTDLIFYKNLEKNSVRIAITYLDSSKNKKAYFFHFTKIKNRWFLTLIDFYTNDCSV